MTEPIKRPVQFHLREFAPADLETLWRLDQVCFTRGIAYSKTELAHYIRQPRAFTIVAESAAGISGFIVMEHDAKGTGRIITIDVHPETRRHGLGTLMMKAAEERLRALQCERIILEVAVDYLPAIRFYKRHGYSVAGTIARYYLDSLDALRMEKKLALQN